MTSLQMIDILGDAVTAVLQTSPGTKDHQNALENAEFIAKLAKQHANQVDLVIRGDKACGVSDRTNRVIG